MGMATATARARHPKPSRVRAEPVARRLRTRALLGLAAPCWLAAPALAQDVPRGLAVDASASVSATATDNYKLSAQDRQSELVTQVTPGVRASLRGGRVSGFLDYGLTGVFYAQDNAANDVRHNLRAGGNAELVENHLYVDARASVSRRAISAFGTQEAVDSVLNNNATDVGSVSITPILRGQFAGLVSYDLRASRTLTRAKDTDQGDGSDTLVSAHLGGGSGYYGWGLDGSHSVNDFRTERRLTNDRVYATLSVLPDPELQFALRGGRESTNARSLEPESNNTYGGSVTWQPSARTTMALDADHRYFGNAHSLSFQHRWSRSAIRFSDTRSASTSSSAGSPTLYNLYASSAAFSEANYPDPVLRDLVIRTYISLMFPGVDPNAMVPGGYLTSSATLSRRQDLSLAVSGVRDTITLMAFRSNARQLDSTITLFGDDFGKATEIRQIGWSVSLGHRLTPEASLNVSLTRLKTLGSETALGNDLRSFDVNWSGRLGVRTTISLGGRHSESEGSSPYRETAATATLSHQF